MVRVNVLDRAANDKRNVSITESTKTIGPLGQRPDALLHFGKHLICVPLITPQFSAKQMGFCLFYHKRVARVY